MSYKTPTLRELKAIADEMKKSYKGTNVKRLSFIALYDQLVQQTTRSTDLPQNIINVLVGALVFELSDIKFNEYRGGSCKKSVGWLWSSGSELYSIINNKLNISNNNQFGYDERLFYLNEFYKYVDKIYPEEGINELRGHLGYSPEWRDKLALKKQIHELLKPLLNKNHDHLYALVHGVPVLNALLKNLQKLEDEYIKSKSYLSNTKRLATINCIKFIAHSYEEMNASSISWHACVGAVIFALIQINREYKVLSATRSSLFRNCLKAINAESLEKISIDDKIKCLRALSAHLTMVKDSQLNYEKSIKKLIATSTQSKLEFQQIDKEIKEFQSKIEQYISMLDVEKQTPSTARYAVSTGVSYTFQYAIGPVAVQAAKNVVVGGLSVGGFFAGGPVGSALFGAAGMILVSGVGRLITEGVVNAVSANLCVWLLEKVGNTLGNATATVVSYPFAATPKGFEEMRARLKPEDDMAFVNMVNTLLNVDIVSGPDKEHIRNVFGLDNDAYLLPIALPSKQSVEEQEITNKLLTDGYHVKIL